MDNNLIFDATTKPFPWIIIWSPVFACAFGGGAIILEKLNLVRHSTFSRFSCRLMLIGGLISVPYFPLSWYYYHAQALRRLALGRFDSVQGTVSDFTPESYAQNTPESFTISGHKFSYASASLITPCFSQTAVQHGPIHLEMVLKIKFQDNCILQIEEVSSEVKPAVQP